MCLRQETPPHHFCWIRARGGVPYRLIGGGTSVRLRALASRGNRRCGCRGRRRWGGRWRRRIRGVVARGIGRYEGWRCRVCWRLKSCRCRPGCWTSALTPVKPSEGQDARSARCGACGGRRHLGQVHTARGERHPASDPSWSKRTRRHPIGCVRVLHDVRLRLPSVSEGHFEQ